MKLKKFLKLNKRGERCISISQMMYDQNNNSLEITHFEEEDKKYILRSKKFKEIANMQVEHFCVIGGGMYPVEICIYVKSKVKEHRLNELDEKIEKIKSLQRQLEYRTKMEEEAIKLVEQCKFEEANKILNTLKGNV